MELLSIVIPCYYAEKMIESMIERIVNTVERDNRYDYEIICVNDGSKDRTYEILCELAKSNEKIKPINLAKNFGQHSALMAGFNYVSGDIVITLDDDGQNPPEEMFKLVDKLNEGYDIVSAKYPQKMHSAFRNWGARVAALMTEKLIGKPKDLDLTSYYAVRRFVIDEIVKYKNPYPLVDGLYLRTTTNIVNVEVTHYERKQGESGYNFLKLLSLWMDGATEFSVKPLRMASFVGVIAALIGFVFGAIVIIRKLVDPTITLGYSSIIAVLVFFFGLILIFLGIIGEYVGRIYISLNDSPQFVVKEKKNFDDKNRDR